MPSFDLIILDCDGVLIDSEVISARVLLGHLASFGVMADMHDFRTRFLGRSWPKVAAEVRSASGVTLPDDFEAAYRRTLLEAFEHELHAMPGVTEVLAQLAVPACVATSSSPPRARRSLELTGLLDRFAPHVFTASEVEHGKPAPDLFLHAARVMGAEPARCLVIEDSMPGMAAGQAAGMQVWHFTGGSHLAGGSVGHGGLAHRSFDNWTQFFDMEPGLRASARAS
ncbi:MAG: HAD family hydrolase [Rhizobiaceae bacterium]|jgi:HAD superfamily hydrolase (TIGR01509 family)|nr:HAD family hydrolase [Rhizobiaceae bacterium]